MHDLHDYETNIEEREFMKAIEKGNIDVEEGRESSLADAKKRLNIKQ